MRTKVRSLTAIFLAWALATQHAAAADLRIGFKAEVTSGDPHVLNGQNRNVWMHVYESLVQQDDSLQSRPGLALRWRLLDELTWEFTLRPNVTFHDGSPLTAEDVKFSIERAMALQGPRTFRSYLKEISHVAAPTPTTLIVKTRSVAPTTPDNLGLIAIVSRKIGKDDSEASFASGKAAIGTGPYRFVEWAHGQRIALERNPNYWGARQHWDKVVFQFISNDAARASALLSGTVDLVDNAASSLSDAFERSGKMKLASATSYFLIYMYLDQFRDDSPFVKDNDDKPLTKNPLKDKRVREAINLAVNRDLIAKRIMKGDAEPTAQIVPAGFFGHDPALKPATHNPARAKALLAEAGYPQGFKISIHCSNDRYLNDAKVCEALGQMLTQAGIKTEVKTLPFGVFQTRSLKGSPGGEPEFSLGVIGVGAVTGDSLEPLFSVVHSSDAKLGLGANNRGRYSNAAVDEQIRIAAKTTDDQARQEIQKAIARQLAEDLGIIPLHHLKAAWAFKKELDYVPRSDGFTLSANAK